MHRWNRTGLAVIALTVGFWLWPEPPTTPTDRPLEPLPAEGALRIVAFGTSLTSSNTWPDLLQVRLATCLQRLVTVTRVAQNRADSRWAEAHISRVEAAHPDLVLMEFVTNDADLLDGTWLAQSRARHEIILDRLSKAQVMLLTMNPVSGPIRQMQRPFLAAYNTLLRDLAVARGLALADLAPRWQAAMASNPALTPPDGLHPTDIATAQVIVPVLADLIAPGC